MKFTNEYFGEYNISQKIRVIRTGQEGFNFLGRNRINDFVGCLGKLTIVNAPPLIA